MTRPARALLAFLFACTLALTLALAAAAGAEKGPSSAKKPAVVVSMTRALRYEPATVRVHVGDTVEWHNVSQMKHTVTADPGQSADRSHVALPQGAQPFDSGRLAPNATYQHTFTVPGTYRYFCIPHEAQGMVGTVIVAPLAAR